MKTGRITDRTARAVWDVDALVAVEREEKDARMERAEIDRLLAEVDRELAEEEQTAVVRVDRSFTDARRAWRAVRRGERAALRVLPSRWDVANLDGEAA
ncbi:hypothetical protein B1813_06735 [Saccharomonospora piscinae]|uniref:Uncharacterized protein n=1 Tax=Saccharomonospora piscinae TaxID=687388 RepID=A0A1V9A4V2_SACPI|nr:hypothetical protein [Saccharomonospora piscinae]OQO91974.1 hypothetical protein B1813_06735 [Saccharomonospora piscinae]